MPTRNIVPRANGEGSLGTSAKKWGAIYADEIVLANEQTLEAKLNAQDAGIASKFDAQDGVISAAIASQDATINSKFSVQDGRLDAQEGRLNAQDAEIDRRLGAQETTINQLSAQKVDKTTYDADMALKANQVDLEALAGTSEIVASGDGYVRWANGLQICWGIVRVATSGSGVWNFSVPFLDEPMLSITDSGGNNTNIWRYKVSNVTGETTGIKATIYCVNASNSFAGGNPRCIAVGKWK